MRIAACLLTAILWSMPAAQAATEEVPQHLAYARELVVNVKSSNNQYKLGASLIRFPGDKDSGGYAVRADCSGFLLAIFVRSGYKTRASMAYLGDPKNRKRPRAEDFVYSFEQGKGFARIRGVENIRPGDLLAHAMLEAADKAYTGTTGHVFLIDSVPKRIAGGNPEVPGTTQYEVLVIDSNEEHVGADDTRLAFGPRGIAGLGRGTIRLYADAQGELVGWARTFRNTRNFFSYDARFPSNTKLRKAAVGRVQAAR
jgi:hypothetical protein